MSDRLNVGELRMSRVLLFTREVAAILHEVCSRLSEADELGCPVAPPTPQHIWVTAAGELVMDTASARPGDIAASTTMAGLASLIEVLLPPTIRNQPDYA